MKKSKYAKHIKISKEVYAVFNNLMMKPIFLNKESYNNYKENQFDKFSEEELNILYSNGILVDNNNTDKDALSFIRKSVADDEIKNRIVLMYIIPNNFAETINKLKKVY